MLPGVARAEPIRERVVGVRARVLSPVVGDHVVGRRECGVMLDPSNTFL